jgi:uncharacterized protein
MIAQRNIAALATGVLFGLGLGVAQMIDPNKIINFLDIAGAWDASLMLVLGAAVTTTFIAFRVILRQPAPRFGERFLLPKNQLLDARLLIGAALFGIGWGLAGYCPGPGFAALAIGTWEPVVFIGAMLAGFVLHRVTIRT